MVEGKFPLRFPWKFTEFGKRFVFFTDIEDTLAFLDEEDTLRFDDIEDTITFTEVNI